MRCRCILLVALVGCGRISFGDAPGDAPLDALQAQGDAAATHPCGQPVRFTDSFDDDATDPRWMAFSDQIGLRETNGALRLTFAPSVVGPSFAGYIENAAEVTVGGCVIAEVGSAPAPPGYMYLAWGQTGTDDKVEVDFDTTHIIGWYENGLDVTDVAFLDYDPAVRFVRLFEQDGAMQFEISRDGTTYMRVARTTAPTFDRANATVRLGAGTTTNVTNAGVAEWRSITLRAP